jgi:hypothetical protein
MSSVLSKERSIITSGSITQRGVIPRGWRGGLDQFRVTSGLSIRSLNPARTDLSTAKLRVPVHTENARQAPILHVLRLPALQRLRSERYLLVYPLSD